MDKQKIVDFLDKKSSVSLKQFKELKENKAWKEIMKGMEYRYELSKEELVGKQKIDEIRIIQGRCEEMQFVLSLLDNIISEMEEA